MSKRGKIFHARSHLFLHFLRNQTVSSRVLLILLFQVAVDPRGTSFGCLWVCRWRLRWTAPTTPEPRTSTSSPSRESRAASTGCRLPASATWSWPPWRRENPISGRRLCPQSSCARGSPGAERTESTCTLKVYSWSICFMFNFIHFFYFVIFIITLFDCWCVLWIGCLIDFWCFNIIDVAFQISRMGKFAYLFQFLTSVLFVWSKWSFCVGICTILNSY